MKESVRLITTGIIWTAFTIIMGIIAAAVSTSDSISDLGGLIIMVIVLSLTIGVTLSTRAVWRAPANDADEQTFKLKRNDPRRIERLIDNLDDDDIYDLETLLLAREREAEQRHHRSQGAR